MPFFYTLFLFITGPLFAYHTIDDLMDLKKQEQPSLFVFDLDHTLIEPLTYTGSEMWFNDLLATGDSFEKIIEYYNSVQHAVKMQRTQPEATSLLREILESEHEVVFITSRGSKIIDVTLNQLEQAGYKLKPRADYCLNESGFICANNIYFTSGGHKGKALIHILENFSDLTDKKVVFIDDQLRHVERVEKALHEGGYEVEAYHYTASVDRFEEMKDLNTFRNVS